MRRLMPVIVGFILSVPTFAQQSARRQYWRLASSVFAQNLTNRANYTGYSGVMTSPFFRQATAVQGTRRVEGGVNFGF